MRWLLFLQTKPDCRQIVVKVYYIPHKYNVYNYIIILGKDEVTGSNPVNSSIAESPQNLY